MSLEVHGHHRTFPKSPNNSFAKGTIVSLQVDGNLAPAGQAASDWLGTIDTTSPTGTTTVSVFMRNATRWMVAEESFAAGTEVAIEDGLIKPHGGDPKIGVALQAATAEFDLVEVMIY
jgi:predicted RecA/RadA family phage recombinase